MNQKPQVMVVDDDLAMCGFLQTFLAERGYAPLTITNSDEAVRRFHAERPSAVLLDVVMPGMDGFAVCAALRATERGKRLPIILLTGRDDVDTRLEGMQSGVSEFLTKPVTRHELVARVRAQLHIVELTRQLETVEHNLKGQRDAGASPKR